MAVSYATGRIRRDDQRRLAARTAGGGGCRLSNGHCVHAPAASGAGVIVSGASDGPGGISGWGLSASIAGSTAAGMQAS